MREASGGGRPSVEPSAARRVGEPLAQHSSNRFRATLRDATLVLDGELDLGAAGTLAELLTDRAVTTVDLSGVTFIDSYGLRALLFAHCDRQQHHAPPLRLHAPSPPVERLVVLSGLSGHLPMSMTA